MFAHIKPQQFWFVVSLSLLLCLFAYPSLLSGAIDPKQTNSDIQSARALAPKDSSQRLIGTAVSRNPADTFAVIEDVKTRKQWIYREGDLVGKILIKKILHGQIIVDRGKGEEVVKLLRSQMTAAAGSLIITTGKTKTARSNPAYKNGPRIRHYLIDSEEVAAILADPQKISETVDLQPGKLFNRQKGVRINALTVESVFPAMGLRKGDLLLGINGQVITGTNDAVAMLQTMFDESSEAELKVRRRARTYRIHIQDLKLQ